MSFSGKDRLSAIIEESYEQIYFSVAIAAPSGADR